MTTRQPIPHKIDTAHIPIPPQLSSRTSKFDQLPLLTMMVQDSFFVDCTGLNATSQRVYFMTWVRTQSVNNEALAKRVFVSRRAGEHGFRVWRTF